MTKIIRRKRQKFLNSFLTLSRLFFYNLFSVICISSVRRVGIKIWNRTLKRTPNRTRKCTLKCSINKKSQHARQHVRKYTLNFFVSSKLAQFLIVKILQRHFFFENFNRKAWNHIWHQSGWYFSFNNLIPTSELTLNQVHYLNIQTTRQSKRSINVQTVHFRTKNCINVLIETYKIWMCQRR